MSCCRQPPHPDDASGAQRAALERTQLARLTRLYSILREEATATISDETLGALGVDVLDWESYSEYDSGWTDLTPFDRSGFMPLDYASLILRWFRTRLLGLESIEENVWEPVVRKLDTFQGEPRYLIKESIGLELPWHESYHPEYEFKGSWAYFAEEAADVPHAVVTMLDSFCPSADDCHAAFFRSEVQAAVKMTEFQLQQAPRFTHHRTIPVLICTFFGNETARVTQVHFDGVRNRLVVRLSRLLDLSGPNAP